MTDISKITGEMHVNMSKSMVMRYNCITCGSLCISRN